MDGILCQLGDRTILRDMGSNGRDGDGLEGLIVWAQDKGSLERTKPYG
jgi:hypothetical protein